jgi:hypothetical protein
LVVIQKLIVEFLLVAESDRLSSQILGNISMANIGVENEVSYDCGGSAPYSNYESKYEI